MKYIFALKNCATDSYGLPFVADDIGAAVKAVVSALNPKDAFGILSQSALYCIGSFDQDCGCIKKERKHLAVSSLQLALAAKKSVENLADFLDDLESNIAFIRSTLKPDKEVNEDVQNT